MNLPHWQKLLADRGILEVALESGWQPDGNGWKYPVATLDDGQVIHRWKAFDSDHKPKYSWPDGKPETVKYYLLPETIETIQDSGVVYRASGEPDVLAYRAAGIKNALCWFGEGNIPGTVKEDFSEFGALNALDYPDRDNTGHGSALKLATMLAGMEHHVYQLPDTLGDAGDINKLWIACGFDAGLFREQLSACPEMDVSELKSLPDVEPGDDDVDFPPTFYEAIERALHVEAYEDDGWSKLIPCPLRHHEHDHDRPAGAWHQTKHIFYCQKCAANHGTGYVLAKDTANALGIDYREFNLKQQPLRMKPKDASGAKPKKPNGIYSWNQVTDTVVSELEGTVDGSVYEPLPMPFEGLRQFAGLAEMLLPRKMMAIVADSGGGKTSFIETVVDSWRKMGFSGIWYGPEWGKEETIYRAIQRAGGPTYMQVVAHRAWCAARNRGIPEDRRPGKPFSKDQAQQGVILAEEIRCWPGKAWFIEKMSISVDELLERMDDIIVGAATHNERISFVVVDYAQLLRTGGGGVASERIDSALSKVKSFCVDKDLIGIVASQVPKEVGKDAANGNGNMSHHAMQAARSDYFNLVLTINRKIDEEGKPSPAAIVRVAKNSLGTTGEVTMFQNEQLLAWTDSKTKSVSLNDYVG